MLVPQLALYLIEGLTPPGHSVKIIEEEAEDVDFDEECELVGISCMTANAPRAYLISQEFRKRGRTVVLGGIHPTLLPFEALEHADCVVKGEAEGVWRNVVEDHMNGCLERIYELPEPDLSEYVPKNFRAKDIKRTLNTFPILTTKGCPYNCDFCSVSKIYGKKIRHIPIENVIRDIRESGQKRFFFLDDNIVGHPKYAKELLRALIPLKIQWAGMASISLAKNEELLQLAVESGCRAMLFGVESISETQMTTMAKASKDLDELEQAIRKIMKAGIIFHASMIFGFDTDTKESIDETVNFLYKNKVSSVSFCVLTPFPGTKTHEEMSSAGRLITDDWKHYNNRTTVFKPKNISSLELQTEYMAAKRKFYGGLSMFVRWPANIRNTGFHFASNYTYLKQIGSESKRFERLKTEIYN